MAQRAGGARVPERVGPAKTAERRKTKNLEDKDKHTPTKKIRAPCGVETIATNIMHARQKAESTQDEWGGRTRHRVARQRKETRKKGNRKKNVHINNASLPHTHSSTVKRD